MWYSNAAVCLHIGGEIRSEYTVVLLKGTRRKGPPSFAFVSGREVVIHESSAFERQFEQCRKPTEEPTRSKYLTFKTSGPENPYGYV